MQIYIGKALMTNRSKFRVGNMGTLATLLAPGFQTSAMALATPWAHLVKNGVYENGERF